MLARGTLTVAAALVLVWLVILLRAHNIVDGVSPALIGDPELPAEQYSQDLRRLEDARLLNPDPTWRLNRAIALVSRNPERAAAEAQQLVRDEPDNLVAWRVLLEAASGRDKSRARQAWRQVRRLDPLAVR
jgi:predicted Zn-dependent protease